VSAATLRSVASVRGVMDTTEYCSSLVSNSGTRKINLSLSIRNWAFSPMGKTDGFAALDHPVRFQNWRRNPEIKTPIHAAIGKVIKSPVPTELFRPSLQFGHENYRSAEFPSFPLVATKSIMVLQATFVLQIPKAQPSEAANESASHQSQPCIVRDRRYHTALVICFGVGYPTLVRRSSSY
jgi:hypothetical protein